MLAASHSGTDRRPRIPEQTQRELWARAAGRCEFRGCNRLLYRDDLTQQSSNLARISHIVAYSPEGPRGDPVLSGALERDISNLMLACGAHAKIIDDAQYAADYPVALLQEFKREHELRIRLLTEAHEDAQTHVVLLQVPIDGFQTRINPAEAFRAILPLYPAEEMPLAIDLNGLTIRPTSPGYFPIAARCIEEQIDRYLRARTITRLSVFAVAPVALLMHFGQQLGDLAHVDLYQRHRSPQGWCWPVDAGQDCDDARQYEIRTPRGNDDGERSIALLLSVSAAVNHTEVGAALGQDPLVYEVRAVSPGLDFLSSRLRLEQFGVALRGLLEDLRREHGILRPIHVFAPVPAPVAVEFGRNVKGYHPPFHLYEYKKVARVYVPALTINGRESEYESEDR